MDSKHTPGPWTAHGLSIHDTTDHAESQHPQRSACVAVVNAWEGNEATALADARLIAAAPDLLAALEYILNWKPEGWSAEHARDVARAAILKAGAAVIEYNEEEDRAG